MSGKPADVICDGVVCRRVTPEEAAASKAAATPGSGDLPQVFQLLGSTLLGQDGKEVPVSSITGPNKVLALYFSAHWCPPCRHFTPMLANIYRTFKSSHARAADWEVVFVSSDRSEEDFKEYFGEMPWTALPYEQRDAKAELSKLYKVRGIPALVLVDGATGELITAKGRDAVGDDPECENFPWTPKTFQQIMEGAMLVDPSPSGSSASAPSPTPALERLRGKYTLLYFSASWCPPCRRFTPKLVETMAALKAGLAQGAGGAAGAAGVEAVFVSGDREEGAAREYHSHMSWPALPFEDRKRAAELNMLFEVEGIPTLVVLDPEFKVITAEGVGAVSADPAGRRFPWRPQPLEPLSPFTASRINDGPVLLLVVGEAETPDEAAAEEFAKGVLQDVAEATKRAPGGEAWSFLWARKSEEMARSVLEFAGLVAEGAEKLPEGHVALLLDVPGVQATWDLRKKGVEVSAKGLGAAVEDYKAGRLGKGRKLSDDSEEDEDEE